MQARKALPVFIERHRCPSDKVCRAATSRGLHKRRLRRKVQVEGGEGPWRRQRRRRAYKCCCRSWRKCSNSRRIDTISAISPEHAASTRGDGGTVRVATRQHPADAAIPAVSTAAGSEPPACPSSTQQEKPWRSCRGRERGGVCGRQEAADDAPGAGATADLEPEQCGSAAAGLPATAVGWELDVFPLPRRTRRKLRQHGPAESGRAASLVGRFPSPVSGAPPDPLSRLPPRRPVLGAGTEHEHVTGAVDAKHGGVARVGAGPECTCQTIAPPPSRDRRLEGAGRRGVRSEVRALAGKAKQGRVRVRRRAK
mmetsp:Transcript_43212/g.86717  ORF Transcript_43212/g.86717 Transcript_43212/m.86717 type:complete len:311 (+) Transcript_43212:341-1273(+)